MALFQGFYRVFQVLFSQNLRCDPYGPPQVPKDCCLHTSCSLTSHDYDFRSQSAFSVVALVLQGTLNLIVFWVSPSSATTSVSVPSTLSTPSLTCMFFCSPAHLSYDSPNGNHAINSAQYIVQRLSRRRCWGTKRSRPTSLRKQWVATGKPSTWCRSRHLLLRQSYC